MGTLGQPPEKLPGEPENFGGVRFSKFKDYLVGDCDITETLLEISLSLENKSLSTLVLGDIVVK